MSASVTSPFALYYDWPECPHCCEQLTDLEQMEGHGFAWVTVTCPGCHRGYEVAMTQQAAFQVRAVPERFVRQAPGQEVR